MSIATLKDDLEREVALVLLAGGAITRSGNPYGLFLDVIEASVRRHLPSGTRFQFGTEAVQVHRNDAFGPVLIDLSVPPKTRVHFRWSTRTASRARHKLRIVTTAPVRYGADVSYGQIARWCENGWLSDP